MPLVYDTLICSFAGNFEMKWFGTEKKKVPLLDSGSINLEIGFINPKALAAVGQEKDQSCRAQEGVTDSDKFYCIGLG